MYDLYILESWELESTSKLRKKLCISSSHCSVFNPFSAGPNFRRHNLTSVDDLNHGWLYTNISALEGLKLNLNYWCNCTKQWKIWQISVTMFRRSITSVPCWHRKALTQWPPFLSPARRGRGILVALGFCPASGVTFSCGRKNSKTTD